MQYEIVLIFNESAIGDFFRTLILIEKKLTICQVKTIEFKNTEMRQNEGEVIRKKRI